MFRKSATQSPPAQTISAGEFDFELKRKRIKNVNLRLSKDGRVLVSAPTRVPLSFITKFVASHSDWILQRRKALIETSASLYPSYTEGSTHYLWGRAYALNTSQSAKIKCAIINNNLHMAMPVPVPSNATLSKHMDNWYRPQIKSVIPQLLNKWQNIIGVEAKDWGVKKMRTKWGTCNIQEARIWLNLELVKYPIECLEYVVVHELTHLHERNHNKRFYSLMASYLPDWRERELQLENFFKT